jgi:cytochrome c oxidase cbb3-type subunit 1
MDRFVKNFIVVSIIYLAVASVIGVLMAMDTKFISLKFIHSHFMLLGWVSMMIYGVGYHILPRFSGRLIKSRFLGEVQFYLSNIGLIGLTLFYTLRQYNPENAVYSVLTFISGFVEVFSIFLFLYNILATILAKEEA